MLAVIRARRIGWPWDGRSQHEEPQAQPQWTLPSGAGGEIGNYETKKPKSTLSADNTQGFNKKKKKKKPRPVASAGGGGGEATTNTLKKKCNRTATRPTNLVSLLALLLALERGGGVFLDISLEIGNLTSAFILNGSAMKKHLWTTKKRPTHWTWTLNQALPPTLTGWEEPAGIHMMVG